MANNDPEDLYEKWWRTYVGVRPTKEDAFIAGYAAGIERAAMEAEEVARTWELCASGAEAHEADTATITWLRGHGKGARECAVAIRALSPRSEEGRCTCGSGAHPRRCSLHPERYQQHCDELSAEYDSEEGRDE